MTRVDGDYPLYESLASLAAESDLVIRGSYQKVVKNFDDLGGNDPILPTGEPHPSVRRVIYAFTAEGSSGPIYVLARDVPPNTADEYPPVFREGSGTEVVLFLGRIDLEDGSWSEDVKRNVSDLDSSIYYVVGGNQGVFDLSSAGGSQRLDGGIGAVAESQLLHFVSLISSGISE